MSNANITTGVRRFEGKASVIDIEGEVNAFAESNLMSAYNLAATGDPPKIILNFTNLGYMNSSGIGLLVTLLIRAKRLNQRLVAYGLNDHYRQIFQLTRLDEAILLYDTEEAALAD
jgi:anti-sigma B factor antagonist